jgi:hypothetical protein
MEVGLNSSRISRLAAAILVLAAGWVTGCEDNLQKPTSAEVRVTIRPDVAGLETGAEVWVDGALVVDSLTTRNLEYLLTAGEHRIVIRQDCVEVLPADTVVVPVVAGRAQDVDIYLKSRSATLSVTSDPAGLSIMLDGRPTGRVTPAAFTCVEPGSHEVIVRPGNSVGFDVVGDTLKSVEVAGTGNSEAAFTFAHDPLPQMRGTIIELMTSSYCPNCPVADRAAEAIVSDPIYDDDALSLITLHVRWGGMDPFHNAMINARLMHYSETGDAAPIAYFNGLHKTIGSSFPDLDEKYRGYINETYGSDGAAGLYWSNVRIEGDLLRGDLRCVAIHDLGAYDKPQLLMWYAKDSLIAVPDPFHFGHFNGVARSYADAIDLKETGHTDAGTWIDTSVSFDLSGDSNHQTSSLRLVAIVEDVTTLEVLQCRQVRIRTE